MKNKTHQRIAHASCLAIIAIAFGIGLNSARAQITPVGGIARDFTITNFKTGQPLRLYDYQGTVILLDFWAYWCNSCKKAADDMRTNIVQYYRNNGGNRNGVPVQVINISLDNELPDRVDNFIQMRGLELVGADLLGEAWAQFGNGGIPYLVVINGTTNSSNYQAWQVLYSTAGYEPNAIKSQIDAVQTTPAVCVLTAPASGATSSPPVALTASVLANGKIIKRVEFYDGATLIGSTTNPPYSLNWNIAAEGEKTVFARALYGTSSQADSPSVTFTVAPTPPSFVVQPTNQTVFPGGSNSFTVVATGSGPVSYQWQKDQVNLSVGGHYSGCTTPTLVIVNCDANDAASYRCAVANPYGTNISNPATLTVPNVTSPPRIVQQPSNQTVEPGGTTGFFVVTGGSAPLCYQWQKNNANLSDGGHYSGATSGTLTICGADTNDVADYRCVVTNAYGSSTSAIATLTLVNVNGCLAVSNSDYESGFSLAGGGYIGNNWFEWETDPVGVTGYDETGIKRGGGHAQRIRLSGGLYGTSGGVYQRIPATPGVSYTVGVWIYAGDAMTSCSLGVNPAGDTNANSGVTWSTATTNVAWVEKTVTVTATSNYITMFCRVASTDNVKRNGYFDDATPAGLNGPLPLLAQRDGGALTLTWPECPGARLERADSLSEPVSWSAVTNPVTIAAGQKRVTLAPTGNAGLFRLVRE